MAEFKDNDISLAVEWERHDRFLAGNYVVTNVGKTQVLVFDVMFQTDPTGFRTIDPSRAFRWLEQDGTYRIAKFVPAIPDMMKVESPELPYARMVEPGATLAGTVLFPVPLDQMLPYGVAGADTSLKEISGISLTLGFAVIDEALKFNVIGKDQPATYSVWHSWASTRQKLISTVVLAMQLPLKDD